MKIFRTTFYFLCIIRIVLNGNVSAKETNFSAGTRHFGRHSAVAAVNRKLDGYPFAQAVTATGYKIAEGYHANIISNKALLESNMIDNKSILCTSAEQQLPYFVINYGLRKTVQLGSSYGYEVNDMIKKCDIVPESFAKEIAQDILGYITPTTQETAYDIATAAVLYVGWNYAVPYIMNLVNK